MKLGFLFRPLFVTIVAVSSLALLGSCGSEVQNDSGATSEDTIWDQEIIDEDDSLEAKAAMSVGEKVELVNLTVNGQDVLLGGFGSEYPVDEEIAVSATIRIGSSNVPWSGSLYVMVDHGGEAVLEDLIPLDFSSAGDYTQNFGFTPTEIGQYAISGAILDSYGDLLGYYTSEFSVVGTVVEDVDLNSDCAHGRFVLADVEVILIDDDCDGLLERYSCDGKPLVNIAQNKTVTDCGIRISNGTPKNDNKDFRYMDRRAAIAAIPTIYAGGPGKDYITGSAADDLIFGGFKDDNIQGRDGSDTIACGSGNDYSKAEAGNDRMFGGEGNDHIKGGSENDELNGGPGEDYVDGQDDDDLLYGGAGDDFVYGGSGNDRLDCGDGDDDCKGGSGANTIKGGAGQDYCSGGSKNDFIDCGDGLDMVSAGHGDDTIEACDGEIDNINAGGGKNRCVVNIGKDIAKYCNTVIACQ